MKKITVKKILTVLALMIISTAILVSAVYAETAENGEAAARAWKDRLLTLPKFTFQRHKNGISRGECPVYTAPSEDALRLANNRIGEATVLAARVRPKFIGGVRAVYDEEML